MEPDQIIHAAIADMLMDPHNEGHGLVFDAESRYGSTAFDNGFSHATLNDLLTMLREYASDHEEGWGSIKDFMGTIAEYRAMPVSSLAARMRQAARRALNEYNDTK